MATVQTLDKIRVTLEKHLGKTIVLKANKGRKQIVTKVGVLENVYPSVFVVKLSLIHIYFLNKLEIKHLKRLIKLFFMVR